MVSEQVTPGEAKVRGRILRAAQRTEGGMRLDSEQAPLRRFVCLLEMHARRVDAAKDVLQAAADELALVLRQPFRRGCEGRETPEPERCAVPPLELGAELR